MSEDPLYALAEDITAAVEYALWALTEDPVEAALAILKEHNVTPVVKDGEQGFPDGK